MAVQYSTDYRDAANDLFETTVGAAPLLKAYTGAQPANCAAAATGTNVANGTLPSDWLTASSGGVKNLNGTWTMTGAATGTLGYYRIYNSAGTVCHEQGSITATGGGGDMTVDNTSVVNGQTINVVSFTKTVGGA